MSRAFALVLLVPVVALPAFAGRPYRGGAVATPHPYASEAAVQILDQGGNAVDAEVAAAFMIAVADPYHSGLGGGGFAIVWDQKSQKAEVLDFRETAPAAATHDMYLDADGKVIEGRSTDLGPSVGVPGAVAGYVALHKKYGKLSLKKVLAPAIRAAKQGIWVTPKYAVRATKRLDCLRKDEEASRIFLRKDASGVWAVPAVSTLIVQKDLARTLEKIGSQGAAAFYKGPIAAAIAKSVQPSGGVLTEKDLATYQPIWREALEGSYRGHRILTVPPPSAGGLAVLQGLGAMEQLFPDKVPYREPLTIHLFAETLRRIFADRNRYLGDPAFVKIDLPALTSADYVTKLVASIDRTKATLSTDILPAPPDAVNASPAGFEEKHETSHLSIVDRDGNAVGMTTTVNYYFGSCIVPKGTGIVLNDEMDDFAAKPFTPNVFGLVMGEANAVAPGKRPVSSMTPTLVFAPHPSGDQPQKIQMVVGSPGGSTIPTTVMQTIMNVIDFKMNASRAVAWGRVHHQYLPDAIWVDPDALEPATEKALEALGHKLRHLDVWGDAELVLIDPENGVRYSASDPRNEGIGAGQDR